MEKNLLKGNLMHNDLTVCLITYNHAKYVRETLESILAQKTSFSWDIAIYDDHSTDGTTEILKLYEIDYPNRIKLVVQNTNVGALENWKQLLLSASSKYIAYIEGDDYWIDDRKLEKQYAILEKNKSTGLVYTQALQLYPGEDDGCAIGKKLAKYSLYVANPIPSSTVVFRKQCMEGFFGELNERLRAWKMSDYPLWFWIAANWDLEFICEPMSAYRVLQSSTTRTSSKEQWIRSKIDIIDYFYRKHPAGAKMYYWTGKLTLFAEIIFHRFASVARKILRQSN